MTERTDAQGLPRRAEFSAQFDGKTYPYLPAQESRDGVSITRIDTNTYQLSWKKGQETVSINYWIISEGGKTLTWVSTGIENGTQVYNRVAVLEKQ